MSFGGRVPGPALPNWIRARRLQLGELHEVKMRMRAGGLHTVCEEARCPNRSECFARGTATFLINGRVCTRSCSYCSIAHGRPAALDPDEPRQLAEAVLSMGLAHVVITAVDRDDLPDGGASGFVEAIGRLRALERPPTVEVLTPDFRGDMAAVDRIVAAGPEVYNHNVETVPRLYPLVRPQADYRRSLELLRRAGRAAAGPPTKSGLMLGLGETAEELRAALNDLREAGCRILTLGQYLQPSPRHLPVARYVTPEEFAQWRRFALSIGFAEAASGPFVRSSYHAKESFEASKR